jgi:hypothetical protein
LEDRVLAGDGVERLGSWIKHWVALKCHVSHVLICPALEFANLNAGPNPGVGLRAQIFRFEPSKWETNFTFHVRFGVLRSFAWIRFVLTCELCRHPQTTQRPRKLCSNCSWKQKKTTRTCALEAECHRMPLNDAAWFTERVWITGYMFLSSQCLQHLANGKSLQLLLKLFAISFWYVKRCSAAACVFAKKTMQNLQSLSGVERRGTWPSFVKQPPRSGFTRAVGRSWNLGNFTRSWFHHSASRE